MKVKTSNYRVIETFNAEPEDKPDHHINISIWDDNGKEIHNCEIAVKANSEEEANELFKKEFAKKCEDCLIETDRPKPKKLKPEFTYNKLTKKLKEKL